MIHSASLRARGSEMEFSTSLASLRLPACRSSMTCLTAARSDGEAVGIAVTGGAIACVLAGFDTGPVAADEVGRGLGSGTCLTVSGAAKAVSIATMPTRANKRRAVARRLLVIRRVLRWRRGLRSTALLQYHTPAGAGGTRLGKRMRRRPCARFSARLKPGSGFLLL